MKYIKRKSAVKPITGSIVDTTNIDDKTVNTYSANVIDKMLSYSTTEQVIGTWINGKPLYRKVIGFLTGYNNIPTGITNIDTLVDLRGAGFGQPINFYLQHNGAEYFVSTQYEMQYNELIHFCSKEYANRQAYAIIEYTKTTD